MITEYCGMSYELWISMFGLLFTTTGSVSCLVTLHYSYRRRKQKDYSNSYTLPSLIRYSNLVSGPQFWTRHYWYYACVVLGWELLFDPACADFIKLVMLYAYMCIKSVA